MCSYVVVVVVLFFFADFYMLRNHLLEKRRRKKHLSLKIKMGDHQKGRSELLMIPRRQHRLNYKYSNLAETMHLIYINPKHQRTP